MASGKRRKPVTSSVKKDEIEEILQRHLLDLGKAKHINHAVAAVERMDGSFKWSGAEGSPLNRGKQKISGSATPIQIISS